MFKFQDNQQNQWKVDLNIGGVIDVNAQLGINLMDPSQVVDELALPAKLLTDDMFLAKVVYILIKDQLDKNGITEKQFFSSLDAKALVGMGEAFADEYQAFFMSRGRKILAEGFREMREATQKMYDLPLEESLKISGEAGSQSPKQDD